MEKTSALVEQPFSGLFGEDLLLESYEKLRSEAAIYLDKSAIDCLLNTAIYGAKAHSEQKRQSGEPYFTHPLAVALILATQRFDLPILQAALLHDVLEDTAVTVQEMTDAFGEEVTTLVDGVSKLDQLKDQRPQQVQAESFKKMLVATTDDPRVIIIKLADRLHNMRTLGALRPEKRIRKAKETLEIYASIAGKLGLFYFRMQLEDLAFSHLYPLRYAVIKSRYTERFHNSRLLMQVRKDLFVKLKALDINATISKRRRHLWGIYKRMERKQSFKEACRTIPIRIVTDTEDDCYRILGILHGCYRPISGKFEDYIAAPKSNGYRSLHTSVLTKNRDVLNVQIRTADMHSLAELGIIAIWHQHVKNKTVGLEQHSIEAEKYMRDWLSRLKEVQNITHDPIEFYDAIKKELTSGAIHVYTPKGEVIDLPAGATAVDFAYAIHTKIGDKCVAAKINGLDYPLFKPLKVAQTVEIITDKNAHPYANWLQFVVTAKARAGVKHHLRSLQEKEASRLGLQLLDNALKEFGSSYSAAKQQIERYARANQTTTAKLLSDLAHGKKQAGLVSSAVLGKHISKEVAGSQVLEIHSRMDSAIMMAECCHPIPKEPIIGHIEPNIGIKIHRRQCLISDVYNGEDWIQAQWADNVSGLFVSVLEMQVLDKPKMLVTIAEKLAQHSSNILDFKMGKVKGSDDIRSVKCWVEVKDRTQLAHIIVALRAVDDIIQINRL